MISFLKCDFCKDYVTNRKIRNLENIEGIDNNAEIWKLLYYLRQMKGNCKRMKILMPTEQSSYRGKKPTVHNKL
jgi:hypothetical protein